MLPSIESQQQTSCACDIRHRLSARDVSFVCYPSLLKASHGFGHLQPIVTASGSATCHVLHGGCANNSLLRQAPASAVQLAGQGLIPFSVDKQNVVLLTLQQVFSSLAGSPVFYLNISNYSPAGAMSSAGPAPGPAPAPASASAGRCFLPRPCCRTGGSWR